MNRAFTIVELLIVVSILAVLAGAVVLELDWLRDDLVEQVDTIDEEFITFSLQQSCALGYSENEAKRIITADIKVRPEYKNFSAEELKAEIDRRVGVNGYDYSTNCKPRFGSSEPSSPTPLGEVTPPPTPTTPPTPILTISTPGTPSNLRQTETTYNSIAISWDAPSETGGASIDKYDLHRYTTSTDCSSGSAEQTLLTNLSTDVDNLGYETSYYFKVRARNSAGWGSFSDCLEISTKDFCATTEGSLYNKYKENSNYIAGICGTFPDPLTTHPNEPNMQNNPLEFFAGTTFNAADDRVRVRGVRRQNDGELRFRRTSGSFSSLRTSPARVLYIVLKGENGSENLWFEIPTPSGGLVGSGYYNLRSDHLPNILKPSSVTLTQALDLENLLKGKKGFIIVGAPGQGASVLTP